MKRPDGIRVVSIIIVAFLLLPLAGMAADVMGSDISLAGAEQNRTSSQCGCEASEGGTVLPRSDTSPRGRPPASYSLDESTGSDQGYARPIGPSSPAFLLPDEYLDTNIWKPIVPGAPDTGGSEGIAGVIRYDLLNETEKIIPSAPESTTITSEDLLKIPEYRGIARPYRSIDEIFPPDDRIQINDTQSFPWCTLTRIYSTFPNNTTGTCSGAVIDDFHVLTAGHCIHMQDLGGWATDVMVVPAQDEEFMPFSRMYSTHLYSWLNWTENQDWNYDLGLIVLDRNIGDYTGWMGRMAALESDPVYTGILNTAGYPADTGGDKLMSVADYGIVANFTRHWYWMDTYPGQSGSPVWVYNSGDDSNYIVTVNTHEGGPIAGNSGTRLNFDRYYDIIDLLTADPSPVDYPDLVDDGDVWSYPNVTLVSYGDPFTLSCDVRNYGTGNSGGFYVDYWLSSDEVITGSDYYLGWVYIADIDPFAKVDADLMIESFPDTLPPGTYYIGYVLDSDEYVDEFNEMNNIAIDSLQITVDGDSTPPGSITNLTNTTYASTYITWTWIDPPDADFDHVMVEVKEEEGIICPFKTYPFSGNVSSGVQALNVTGLKPGTFYTIATQTVDTSGNVNATSITHTAMTHPEPEKIGIFSSGNWYVDCNGDGGFTSDDRYIPYGAPNWTGLVGDWNGDGLSEIGIYNDAVWYLDYGGSGVIDGNTRYYVFGAPGWAAVTGDWDGNGTEKIGIYQDGNWYLDYNGNGYWDGEDKNYGFGAPGWTPVVGKWTSEDRDKIGIYNGGNWYLDINGDGFFTGEDQYVPYGALGWTHLIGDWNGDGKDEIGINKDTEWYLDYGGSGEIDANTRYYVFGASGWTSISGDWDGDTKDEIGIYQGGNWYLDYNGNGYWDGEDKNFGFGAPGWMPVIGKWVY